jgi:hypothetical protein
MTTPRVFKFPYLGKLGGLHWSNAAPPACTLGTWVASVFELRRTADRDRVLAMAAEHGIGNELLTAEKESRDDAESVRSFENIKREADRIAFAVFMAKCGLVIAVELSAPSRFEAEARTIFECYAEPVRQKLAKN